MSALATAAIIFACLFGGALLGMALRAVLPQHHLDDSSKDVVKTGMGLVATMAALVLGLLVASAKSSYDAQKDGLDELAASITLLDTVLAQYGPAARDAREILRQTMAAAVDRLWPADPSQGGTLGAAQIMPGGKSFYGRIIELSPTTPSETALQHQAEQIAASLGHQRLLLIAHAQSGGSSGVFLLVVAFWLTVLFASFGLFAPRNTVAVIALMLSALSVAGAIFLTLELTQPFGGLIEISSAPLRSALAHLGE